MSPVSMAGLPEVRSPKPFPLEGVKSRQRAIFNVPKAYFKSCSGKYNVNAFSGLELTLESRVAIVGNKRGCTELLLGTRELVTGAAYRHDDLLVLHLGPHLLDSLEQSVEQYLAASAAALKQSPQVIILDEAAGADNEAWSQAFRYLLDHQEMHAFCGALVICIAQETPALRQICKHRWTGAGEWVWQETIQDDDGLEFLEDVLSVPNSKVPGLPRKDELDERIRQEVRDLAWKAPFKEDMFQKAEDQGWNLIVLTMPASLESEKDLVQNAECQSDMEAAQQGQPTSRRSLAGFMFYSIGAGRNFDIARLAVVESLRSSGCGRRLMRFALEKAARMPLSECAWITIPGALDTAVPFYERFGFMDMTDDDVESDEHFQTFMEMPNASIVFANPVPMAPPLA